jgi:enamine deaminase RidA (YjgF/YER057c/UK114 family)
MERRVINPWTWQDAMGFVQANEVTGAQRVLICSGQTSVDAEGNVQHAGDMRGQIGLCLDNLEALLSQAGLALEEVMRLNIYTTDMDAFFENYDAFISRLGAAGCRFAGSLLGVQRLADPALMLEIEATAVR